MIESWLIVGTLMLIRTSACIAFLPAPLGRGAPATVRIGLSVALAWFSAQSLSTESSLQALYNVGYNIGWARLAYLAARETALGLGIAWLAGLVVVPAQVAGTYLSQEIGLSLGSQTSPLDQSPSSVLSSIFEYLTTAILVGLNLHYVWLWSITQSFDVFPVGGGWNIPAVPLVVDRLSQAEQLGLVSIGPVVVVMFLTLVFLLAASRTTPQINLFTFGMPVRSIVGGCALLLFLPEILLGLSRSMEILVKASGGW